MFELNDSLGYYFSKSYKLFSAAFDKLLTQNGYQLNSDHWTVLIILTNNPGINQSDISKIVQRDKPAVTRIIDFLEKDGFVERKQDANDRRAHNVFLTNNGKNLYKKLLILAEELNKKVIEGVDPKGIEIMKETLTQLINSMLNLK